MGYIRTKDRILENSDYYFIDNTCEESYKSCNGVYYLSQNDIVDRADMIDDLLDGYICHKELVRDILVAKSYSETYNLPIYGCIYVEGEGFIIVAKVVDILPNGEVSWSLKGSNNYEK